MDPNFEKYVQRRLAQSGAMTPGQKLEVIRELLAEAQEGRVPVGENAAARLPVDHPAVQAVLRGEEVSLGGTVVKKEGFKGLQDRRVALGLMIGSLLLMVVMMIFAFRLLKPSEPEATPTLEPSPTLEATEIPPTQPPPPTPIPPTPVPPTPTAVFAIGIGGPAESSRDPASLEIAGRLFIVSKGIVGEDGMWVPAGPEWLEGTEVRRVFAVPYSAVRDLSVDSGEMVRVRTRGGAVLEYKVREVLRLMANQIETFVSLKPSVVIFVPMDEGSDVNASERIAILAEAPLILTQASVSDTGTSAYIQAETSTAVNLRQDPGLKSNILLGLAPGSALAVSNYPPVTADEINWIYVAVNSNGGWVYGWLAVDFVRYR